MRPSTMGLELLASDILESGGASDWGACRPAFLRAANPLVGSIAGIRDSRFCNCKARHVPYFDINFNTLFDVLLGHIAY